MNEDIAEQCSSRKAYEQQHYSFEMFRLDAKGDDSDQWNEADSEDAYEWIESDLGHSFESE